MSEAETHAGPWGDHDRMMEELGLTHPYNAEILRSLLWYDGPQVAIARRDGDERPWLWMIADSDHEGEEATRVFHETVHLLAFDRIETLEATLDENLVPTTESYRLAETIVVSRRSNTRIGHPEPRHETWTRTARFEDMDAASLAITPGSAPRGLWTPSVRPTEEDA